MLGVQERLVSVARSPLTAGPVSGRTMVTPWSHRGFGITSTQSYGQTFTHSDKFSQSSQKLKGHIDERQFTDLQNCLVFKHIPSVQWSEVWSHHTASQSPDDGGSIMTIRSRLQAKVDEENIVVYTLYDIFVKQ